MNLNLQINYPYTIPDMFQESKKEFEKEARMGRAAKFFELKRLSSGMPAKLTGMEGLIF